MTGVLWGGTVAAAGLAVISQVAPPPGAPMVQGSEVPVSVAVTAEDLAPETGMAEDASGADSVTEAPAEAAPAADSSPAAQPDAGPAQQTEASTETESLPATAALPKAEAPAVVDSVSDGPSPVAAPAPAEPAPALALDAAEGRVGATAPAAPSALPEAAPETAPGVEPEDAAVRADAAAATPPEVAHAAPAATPPSPAAAAERVQPPGQSASAPMPEVVAALPVPPTGDAAPAPADLPPPPPLTAEEEALLQPVPEPEEGPLPAEIAPQVPEAEPVPEAVPEVETQPEPAPLPVVRRAGQAGEGRLAPDPGLATEGAPPATAETAADLPVAEDLPPVARYAAAFDAPEGRPLFSILLRDTGGPALDRAALAAISLPVTFVIDPMAPDAETAAAMYREGGHEVAFLATGLPEGATAADLEQSFSVHAGRLPEAVAVVDLPTEDGFQGDRPLATQVVGILKAQGRGVVTFDRGLDAAGQVATREGVPHAAIFRVLDSEGEDTPLIRRYLDRAAFKAAQDGQVVVLGDTRPETVAAILEWAVEGRSSSVAVAPLTAVLTRP